MELTKSDIEKIHQIVEERKRAHSFYKDTSSVYNSFLDMEREAFSSGSLEQKHKEMIAIGISIHINCESCLEWHIKQALQHGASKEEIIEAIGVGIEMGGGPATVSSRFAMTVLEYYTENKHT